MAAVPIVAALLLAPVTARAQVRRDTTARRDTTTRRDTIRAPGDTLQRDSTAKFEVEWAEPDSIMSELLSREGYTATKYQGERVEIRAKDKSLKFTGSPAHLAQSLISALEGAMMIARTYGDVERFRSASDRLLGSVSA